MGLEPPPVKARLFFSPMGVRFRAGSLGFISYIKKPVRLNILRESEFLHLNNHYFLTHNTSMGLLIIPSNWRGSLTDTQYCDS